MYCILFILILHAGFNRCIMLSFLKLLLQLIALKSDLCQLSWIESCLLLGRLFNRVDLIKPVSNVCAYDVRTYVGTSVHPQNVFLISMKFGT